MFFLDSRLTELMKDSFKWSDDQISGMNYLYFDTVFKMIINDTIEFLEVNAQEDLQTLQRYTKEAEIDNKPEKQVKILQYVFALSDKHLKLQQHLFSRMNKLNTELIEDFINSMDYETGLKLIEIMDKEMNDMNKFEKKFLNFAEEKAEKPR